MVPLGWWGAFVLALFANAIVMYIGIELAPGIEDDGFLSIFIASWIYAVLAAVFEWLLLSDADDAFLAYAIRMAGRRKETVPVSTVPGVLFVQLDGVPYPVLDLGIKVGTLPEHLAVDPQRLAPRDRSGPPGCRRTTPVSQAGILHGTAQDMPAFRWYEKDSARLVVSNQPAGCERYRVAGHRWSRPARRRRRQRSATCSPATPPTSLLTMSGIGGCAAGWARSQCVRRRSSPTRSGSRGRWC